MGTPTTKLLENSQIVGSKVILRARDKRNSPLNRIFLMTRRIALMLAAVAAVLQSPVLLGQGQQDRPTDPRRHLPGRGELRRCRRGRHRRNGTICDRPDARRLRGVRRRKAAEDRHILTRGNSAREAAAGCRCGRPIAPDAQTNRRPFDGRVVFVLDDLDVSAMRGAQVRDAARKFVQQHMGANDVAAVVYERPHRRVSGIYDQSRVVDSSDRQVPGPPAASR